MSEVLDEHIIGNAACL